MVSSQIELTVPARPRSATTLLAVLGVVYGDIGTSPLYALRECFNGSHGTAVTPDNILGVVSLILWSLILVVSGKYLVFIMRANNQGEGGILALLSLAHPKRATKIGTAVLFGGLFGACLLYSDGVITPAISVLSAIEGLEMVTSGLKPFVVPLSAVILVSLFAIQRRGTGGVGAIFGPLMLIWFATIAAAGLPWIFDRIDVLAAFNPLRAVRFMGHHGSSSLFVLGNVVLCITGAEALYADMGHFGHRPIRTGWYSMVLPALVLNYLGQGALLLARPDQVVNPFFGLVPRSLLVPMVIIATVATVIASQALISGAFSLTRQAIQLGYLPRLTIVHTSSAAHGQIYVPEVNWLLMSGCVGLVIIFGTSSSLAAAYGMAVTGTMVITTLLFFRVARTWWGPVPAGLACGAFLVIDLPFAAANISKLRHGAWVPLVMALAIIILMATWRKGRDRLARYMTTMTRPLIEFVDMVRRAPPMRVPGTAVFMTSTPTGTPPVLIHHLRHSQVLHEQVVLLSIVTERQPYVDAHQRVTVEPMGEGFYRVVARYGFMETPRVTEVLKSCRTQGLRTSPGKTSYFLGRERLVISEKEGMRRWRKGLFSFMSRNAYSATDFFSIPTDRVLELGIHVEL
jgi:KUP system potassium uptake protein